MSIIYRKGSVNKADAVSRCPDFFHPDDAHMRMIIEMFAFWWDGNVHDMCYLSNDTALLVIRADAVVVDDDFMTMR